MAGNGVVRRCLVRLAGFVELRFVCARSAPVGRGKDWQARCCMAGSGLFRFGEAV